MTALSLADLINRARGPGHAPNPNRARKVRLVIRVDRPDVDRLDTLRPRFKASRAAMIRVFIGLGLDLAEAYAAEHGPELIKFLDLDKTPPAPDAAPEEGAP